MKILVRLAARELGRLIATSRLLRHGFPQTPSPAEDSPAEDVLRLRAGLNGWSRTLPVSSRGAIKYFLRLAWQEQLEFHSISPSHYSPMSLFVDSGGSLRFCGVELQNNDATEILAEDDAARTGSLGFGRDWHIESGSDYFRKEEPTLVPATEGVRMRTVAIGWEHVIALTKEGKL